ncbi:MAG: hypothetical protein HQL95_04405 [Magnetococcales bacterium]|nr:hypothetical protein [Magnetococcales bacterium]
MCILHKLSGMIGMLACTVSAGVPLSGLADTTQATATSSPHTFTSNAGVLSNYIFRGLTQSWNHPAIQGGVDYTHGSGWYAGLLAYSVSNKQYAHGWAELDYYGGYNGKFTDDWSWTAGFLGAYYPGANYDHVNPAVAMNRHQTYNNFELNAGLGYKWMTLKVSVSLTDYYGDNTNTGYTSDSKGSTYLDWSANVPLPVATFTNDVTLPLHIGRTHYTSKLATPTPTGGIDPDYTDYKIGINKGFDGGWNLGAACTYANNKAVYNGVASAKSPSDTLNLGGGNVLLSIIKTF